MSDIKNALEEKRRKLEALKTKRNQRAAAAAKPTPASPSSAADPLSPAPSSSGFNAGATTPLPSLARPAVTPADLLAQVGQLLSPRQEAPTPQPVRVHQLGIAPLAHHDIAPNDDKPLYTRETQTDFDQDLVSKLQHEEQQEKDQLAADSLARKKQQEQKQKELEERIKKETEEDEKKRRDLNAAQKRQIIESEDFRTFFSSASKLCERALHQNDRFDIAIDYAWAREKDDDKKASSALTRAEIYFDKKCSDRPVTSIEWSPVFKELICCSYAQKEDQLSLEPDGLVMIWNTHLSSRPEYSFYCQSAVLTAAWHPGNNKLIIGGTYSGQIVLWDTREKSTPVNRTTLSQGHTHPVFSLCSIPSTNLMHNIISVSTDGRMCVWDDNDLVEPRTTLDLKWQDKEVVTTCLGLPGRDTNSVILGSDEGNLYKARVYEKPGICEAIPANIPAHNAPITQVQFHPTQKDSSRDVNYLFLSSSYDWTVKLWSSKTSRCLYTFESAKDYVYDVQWSPTHPAVFVSGDGTGCVDIWDLNKDTEVPAHRINVLEDGDKKRERAVSRLKWSDDGKHLAVGASDGQFKIFDVASEVTKSTAEDSTLFYEKMKAAAAE